MTNFWRMPGSSRASYSWSPTDIVVVALIGGVVASWATVANRSFSVSTWLACEALFFSFYLAGSIVASFRAVAERIVFDVPLRLLVGFAIVNSSLLILAWISPLGMVGNFALLASVSLWFLFSVPKRRLAQAQSATLWAIGICLIATTLWCRDSIDPCEDHGRFVVFKPWVDGFYHAVHVRIFADSHGASTIEDFRMSGVPARLYHYGMYMTPAVIEAWSDLPPYVAFAGILAPVGVLFTGLAAYTLFGSLLGSWSGLTAVMALLLLPDGYQQGMPNQFMSYHFLTHISPSATYGLALLAVAWLFVLSACRGGSLVQLLFGWGVFAALLGYKFHYVVASALVLLLVPALFFCAPITRAARTGLVLLAFGLYVGALTLGQSIPGVPPIVFDGSGHGEILQLINSFVRPGPIKDFLTGHMGREMAWTANLAWGVPYVLLSALGVFLPIALVLGWVLDRRVSAVLRFFPLLLLVNFVAMFFGLALDMDSSTPDELSHRPVMIVYFFTVTWVGAVLGLLFVSPRSGRRWIRPGILVGAALLLVVPARLGPGVQLFWAMPKISPVRVAKPLIQVAEYLKAHSARTDVFQDSQFDRFYVIAALSERRTFVSHTMTRMPFRGDLVATRTMAVNRLMILDNAKLVVATARAFGLRWFVLHPGNQVKWPAKMVSDFTYDAGSLRVYEFR